MLSFKQGGIKYPFQSLWYDSNWDWTPVSQTIGEHWVKIIEYYQTEIETWNDIIISIK